MNVFKALEGTPEFNSSADNTKNNLICTFYSVNHWLSKKTSSLNGRGLTVIWSRKSACFVKNVIDLWIITDSKT